MAWCWRGGQVYDWDVASSDLIGVVRIPLANVCKQEAQVHTRARGAGRPPGDPSTLELFIRRLLGRIFITHADPGRIFIAHVEQAAPPGNRQARARSWTKGRGGGGGGVGGEGGRDGESGAVHWD